MLQVANIGPADWNHDETMSTLRYANRAKNIKNKPTKNEDPKDAMLRDMQQEMERLRAMLEGEQAPDGVCIHSNMYCQYSHAVCNCMEKLQLQVFMAFSCSSSYQLTIIKGFTYKSGSSGEHLSWWLLSCEFFAFAAAGGWSPGP